MAQRMKREEKYKREDKDKHEDEEEEKDKDSEWDKWCEEREMDEAVHENVVNYITVYKNIITNIKSNDSPKTC